MDKNKLIAALLIIASFAVAAIALPYLPDTIAIHWNIEGTADGFSEAPFGVMIIPAISMVIYLILWLMPKIDPLKKNIQKFAGYYYGFINVFLAFMLYLQIVVILQNIGYSFNMTYAMIPAMAALMYIVSIVLEKAERNWTAGIRTPWTLSSENVWKKTNALAAKLFKAAAVLSLVGLLFSDYAFLIFISAVLTAAFVPIVYSYFEYAKEKKGKKK